ncbi:MAG: TIGR01777 family oxidoreductase [Chitinophagaceae bacterium]|nr:TIGR01777 family oxidoreductase [Chitinophagaceae bacterium]
METVLITGGTGLIGSALTTQLRSAGYRVIILSRSKHESHDERISYAQWDVDKSYIDPEAIKSADHIVHLAGAGIADKRWTKKRKQEIINSRVNSGNLLVKALNEIENNVKTVVSASGIGWYGEDGVKKIAFKESDPVANNFLGDTCRLWEESVQPVELLSKRLVVFRTGIVFANEGGAFPEFVKPMKFGLAAILGSGRQIMSWIHIDDVVRAYMAAIENKNLNGVYNAVSREPVSNKDLTLKIARARKKNFIAMHVPAFVLKIFFGEVSVEVLKSTTVDGSRLRDSGFTLIHPTVDSAVNDLIRSKY